MENNKKFWLYTTLGGFAMLLLFLLIFISQKNQLTFSLTTYFFLLVICALAATAFLSGAFKSTSTWKGTFLKGELKLAGPPVIFFLFIFVGYKFRPIPLDSPFDLTIIVNDATGRYTPSPNDVLSIENGNDPRQVAINSNRSANFPNVNASYRGHAIRVSSHIDGYAIATKYDTTLMVPDESNDNPVLHLTLLPAIDSFLFVGHVISGDDVPVKNVAVNFSSFLKKAITDEDGMFQIYLPAKIGDKTDVMIFGNGKLRYDNKVILSSNMKIPLNP